MKIQNLIKFFVSLVKRDKPSKFQRHKIYKGALKLIKSEDKGFICPAINSASHLKFNIKDFPEFMAFKPDDRSIVDVWWIAGDKATRIKVLETCIEQTRIIF